MTSSSPATTTRVGRSPSSRSATGFSDTRIQARLSRYGVETRPGGIRAARAAAERSKRRPSQLVDEIVTPYRSGLTRTKTAERAGVHRATVDDVLRSAGVAFRDRRKLPPLHEWVDRYVVGDETAVEIAVTYGASPEAVLRALKLGGIERRLATARVAPLSDSDVLACYVGEGLALRATAIRLDVSVPRVRAAVGWLGCCRCGVRPVHGRSQPVGRRYAAGATVPELGAEFGLSEHKVVVTVRFLELPRRQRATPRTLKISDRQLAVLVAAGHSDSDIATRYRVAVWAVVKRRRRIGLLRPRRPAPLSLATGGDRTRRR